MAPHLGLALLMMLVDSGLITEARSEAMRQKHTRRNLASETSMPVYNISVNPPNRELQRVFYRTGNAFLACDNDTLLANSRAAELQLEWTLLANGGSRPRARARGRMREWRASRERVAVARTRRSAASSLPSRHTHLFIH